MTKPVMGTKAANTLFGTDGSDKIKGKDGNDIIDAGKGNDTIDGGKGDDSAVLHGTRDSYSISPLDKHGDFTTTGADGHDTYKSVEHLIFDDGTLDVLTGQWHPAAHVVDITAGGTFAPTAGDDYFVIDWNAVQNSSGDISSSISGFDVLHDHIVVENAPSLTDVSSGSVVYGVGQEDSFYNLTSSSDDQVGLFADAATTQGVSQSTDLLGIHTLDGTFHTSMTVPVEGYDATLFFTNNVVVTQGDFMV